jgi:acyl dehydratase
VPVIVDNLELLKALVGQELGTSEWITITQASIQQFAELTGDRQWIHIDPQRAERESPYGTTVAHGFFTLALLSHLLKQVLQIDGVRMSVNYGLNRVRFPAPVAANSRIRARFRLISLKDLGAGVETILEATVESEGGNKPCCVAEWVLRYYS